MTWKHMSSCENHKFKWAAQLIFNLLSGPTGQGGCSSMCMSSLTELHHQPTLRGGPAYAIGLACSTPGYIHLSDHAASWWKETQQCNDAKLLPSNHNPTTRGAWGVRHSCHTKTQSCSHGGCSTTLQPPCAMHYTQAANMTACDSNIQSQRPSSTLRAPSPS